MRRSPLLTGVASFVILLLLAVIFVLPQGSRVAEREADLAAAEAELLRLEADADELERFAASGEAQAAFAEIRGRIPTEADLQGLFSLLRRAADEAGVTLTGASPGIPIASTEAAASVIPVTLTAQGTYFALGDFLLKLETLDRLVRVSAISLNPQGGDGAGGQLILQATAEIFTTDLSAGPGSDPAPGGELGG